MNEYVLKELWTMYKQITSDRYMGFRDPLTVLDMIGSLDPDGYFNPGVLESKTPIEVAVRSGVGVVTSETPIEVLAEQFGVNVSALTFEMCSGS